MTGAGGGVSAAFPVAIGGVGGSGTRLGASILQSMGFYIGSDLNDALDNLWFTLLFKRASLLALEQTDVESLAELFWLAMTGARAFTSVEQARIWALAESTAFEHSAEWRLDRARSLVSGHAPSPAGGRWGWKEPNTHVVIDRLFRYDPQLRYIHFQRNPLDMAFSANQNQLHNWGYAFLGRPIDVGPSASLSYWCAIHRRTSAFAKRFPTRVLIVDFDALCAAPSRYASAIADFVGVELDDGVTDDFVALVQPGRAAMGRYRSQDLAQFERDDLAYVSSLGYSTT
jgi:hypothetical protein